MKLARLLSLALLLAPLPQLAVAQGPSPARPAHTVDFGRDVLPILKQHCFACHRGRNASAGYRLDQRAELLGETTGKPLVRVGKSGESRLIQLVSGGIPDKIMPKEGPRLSADQVGVLRAWIDQGLTWDEQLLPPEDRSDHWAFQPIRVPAIPTVANLAWVRTPIDAFIAAKHEFLQLQPAAAAEARTLVRRVFLDLVGLPPSPTDVEEFVRSAAAMPQAALEQLVDRLLASPHYGERWGRHWLDVARWAESEGYESNHLRLHAWRYRDWVVEAFNRDMPFAAFVRAQIAGDEITPYSDDNLIATGFLAAARLSSNEEDRWRQRNDIYVDIVNTTANAFLGLTMQCAQCHSHKFDPISARDYYRLQGFFVKGQPGNLALQDAALWAAYEAKKPAGYDEAVRERDALYEVGRQRKLAAMRKAFTAAQLQALARPMDQRTAEQEKVAREADLLLQISSGQIEAALSPDERPRYDKLKQQVAAMEKGMLERPQTFGFYSPVTSPTKVPVLPMKGFYPLSLDLSELARARPYLLAAGDVHRPSFAVDVGWPAVLGSVPPEATARTPRLALAEWLSSAKNPLAARVHVNRIWQYHIGRGIVSTPNDFGVKGAAPTHPELLDWLACEFQRSGGSLKHLHRLIVLSSTYQQSARASAALQTADPDNRYYSRWQPRRLEAEAIRDIMLAVSNELDRTVGGPSVSADDTSQRRSMYLFQKREAPPAHQALFDGPIAMTESCGRRLATTVPLQPLYLLNSSFSADRAVAFATRVRALAGPEATRQVDVAFQLALGRQPDAQERALAMRFFTSGATSSKHTDGLRALQLFCQALLNTNEFTYVN
jgi:hypothetical protein